MAVMRDDRRVQRTKQTLYRSLTQLTDEKPFDKITVQEILDRANVGRTTFYTHFESKEDLFIGSHEQIIRTISQSFFSETGELRAEPSPELLTFLQMSQQNRDTYFFLTRGAQGDKILRLLRDHMARHLAEQLHDLFQEDASSIPFDLLAQYIAGSMVSLISWWMEKRTPYSAQEIVVMLHQLTQMNLRHLIGKK